MEKPLEERCPTCFHDLRGAQIPNTDPPKYYSSIIGVEISDLYDGTLFWECPYCNDRFHRFRPGTHLWKLAVPYVRRLDPSPAIFPKEKVVLSDDVTLVNVHNKLICADTYCSIHKPSEHPLNKMPRKFENDIILRVCSHGVTHPDPDALDWAQRTFGEDYAATLAEHGCCGARCCMTKGH